MNCPQVVADVVSDLIFHGILQARAAGWSGQPDRCATEADHIHGLPGLMRDYSPELLAYYWDVQRPSYLSETPKEQLAGWEPLWQKLKLLLETTEGPTRI